MSEHRFSVSAEYIALHAKAFRTESREWWQHLNLLSAHANRGLVNGLSNNCPADEAYILDTQYNRYAGIGNDPNHPSWDAKW